MNGRARVQGEGEPEGWRLQLAPRGSTVGGEDQCTHDPRARVSSSRNRPPLPALLDSEQPSDEPAQRRFRCCVASVRMRGDGEPAGLLGEDAGSGGDAARPASISRSRLSNSARRAPTRLTSAFVRRRPVSEPSSVYACVAVVPLDSQILTFCGMHSCGKPVERRANVAR